MAKPTSTDLYSSLLKEIRSAPAPFYYFCGEEMFFAERLQEALIDLIPIEQRDFNLDVLYGPETSVQAVLSAARSYPMMADRRLVIVRDFNGIRMGEREGGLEMLTAYLQQPNPSTILCFTDTKGPDKRTLFGKKAADFSPGGLTEFPPLPDWRLADWVMQWTHSSTGKKMQEPAAHLLAELVGNRLHLLSAEIDKVSTFVNTSDVIRLEDVKDVIGSYREFSTLELKDAILAKDLERSLATSEQILLQSDADLGEVLKTIGLLHSIFSNIWQVRRLQEKGLPPAKVRQEMGIHSEYFFNRLLDDAKNYQRSQMPAVFEALLDADMAAKGFGSQPVSGILFLMIRRIIAA